MLNNLKIKRGFSRQNQLKFIINYNMMMNHRVYSNPARTHAIEKLKKDFPYIASVLIGRLKEGKTFKEAVKLTFHPNFAPYMLSEEVGFEYNADMAKVLLCHQQCFVRKQVGNALGMLVALGGFMVEQHAMTLAGAGILMTTALIWSPIDKLHAKMLDLD